MKIFLSALSNTKSDHYMMDRIGHMKWNLLSYYYIQKDLEFGELIKRKSDELLIDSGAHSFQKGKKVDWDEYTDQYAKFIKNFDSPKVVGFFEMDIDGIIGYENVLKLRKKLDAVSDKIIPVWHDTRGIDEFYKMCDEHRGRIVAISGYKNCEIKSSQYIQFLKVAKQYGCKMHCLGMTQKKILDKVPFDYTDSSTWKMQAVYGNVYFPEKNGHKKFPKGTPSYKTYLYNYRRGMEMQRYYHNKWRKVCGD